MSVGHDLDRLGNVVEDHHRAVEPERQVRQIAVVGGAFAQGLVVTNEVVAGIADRGHLEQAEAAGPDAANEAEAESEK